MSDFFKNPLVSGPLNSLFATLNKFREMPSVMEQERTRQEQLRPLLRQGKYREALLSDPGSPFEGFGPQDLGVSPFLGTIRAYHGSPHVFSKFSSKNIGTGEGAQAYGHGLYFAESPAVAKSYREALAGLGADARETAKDFFDVYRNYDDAAKAIDDQLRGGFGYNRAQKDQLIEARRLLKEHVDLTNQSSPGKLYEVDIDADPEDFLDWDLPLSKQPKNIQEAIRSQIPDSEIKSFYNYPRPGQTMHNLYPPGKKPADADPIASVRQEGGNVYRVFMKGSDAEPKVYDSLLDAKNGALREWGDPPIREIVQNPETTKKLLSLGVKGIRYKDAMSRGAEGGTSNYVVFDDELIKVLSRE